jgi:hypothetical protein
MQLIPVADNADCGFDPIGRDDAYRAHGGLQEILPGLSI